MARAFVNWSRTVRSQPTRWAAPTSEDEVVAVVREVRARGGRLRAVGSGHSWSAIAASDDVQITTDALGGLIAVDPDAGTATVGAGTKLHQIVELLAAHGLALPVLGSIHAQAIAGAIATATHGSSLHVGNLSDQVVGVRLVDGTGEVRDVGPGDPELGAVRVHLGALGLLTRVTLRVVPLYRLRETRTRLPFDAAAEALVPAARDHAFAKLWWIGPSDDGLLFTYDRTDDPEVRAPAAEALDRLANAVLFPGILASGRVAPALIPRWNRLVDALHFQPGVRVARYDRALTLVMPPRHRESERAFPLDRTADAMKGLRAIVARHRHGLDFITECRVVRGDDAWLSPTVGRDACQVGVYGTHSPDLDPITRAFDDLVGPWGARPHWGKETAITWGEVRRLWPRAEDFRSLTRAWDPDGVFRNPFLDRVLGLG